MEANLDAEERGIREESFFNNLPWNILPRTRRGVQALKKYLADLLCSRIQLGFPTMLEAIQHRRFQATKQLESLGQSRESIEQKRAYLSRVAQCYHTQALAALNGRYGSLQEDSMKLRKAIRDANDAFGHEMKKNGHLVPFADIPTPPGIAIDESDPSQDRPEVNKATLQTKIKSAQDDQILSHDLENASSSTSDEELPSAKVNSIIGSCAVIHTKELSRTISRNPKLSSQPATTCQHQCQLLRGVNVLLQGHRALLRLQAEMDLLLDMSLRYTALLANLNTSH